MENRTVTELLTRKTDNRVLREWNHSICMTDMYTDWSAIPILLFTTVPLLAVLGAATVFVLQNKERTPLN